MGIEENSKESDIKNAYYDLAKKYHPDINKGNDDKFKVIS